MGNVPIVQVFYCMEHLPDNYFDLFFRALKFICQEAPMNELHYDKYVEVIGKCFISLHDIRVVDLG